MRGRRETRREEEEEEEEEAEEDEDEEEEEEEEEKKYIQGNPRQSSDSSQLPPCQTRGRSGWRRYPCTSSRPGWGPMSSGAV